MDQDLSHEQSTTKEKDQDDSTHTRIDHKFEQTIRNCQYCQNDIHVNLFHGNSPLINQVYSEKMDGYFYYYIIIYQKSQRM